MNRERFIRAKRELSRAAGAAAALNVAAKFSGSSFATSEAAALREALATLERLVDESRDETARGERMPS